MKKIDMDIVILIGFSLIFSIFLLLSNDSIKYNHFTLVKEDKMVTIYRKDTTSTISINEYLVTPLAIISLTSYLHL